MENLNSKLGTRIKTERRRQKMTQQHLAAGICSQSMLSSIENETYTPNVLLFAQLCARLNVSMERLLLDPYPTLSAQPDFNRTVIDLCNQHAYAQMLQYLSQTMVINQLTTDRDLQTYYYYLGIATYQSHQDWQAALQQLTMARSYSPVGHNQTVLELLILATAAFIKYRHKNQVQATAEFNACLTSIEHQAVSAPNNNLNSIYYLYGNCLYNQGEIELGLKVVNQGISYTTSHDSHFMLADLYLLKSALLAMLKRTEEATQTAQKAQTLSEIFKTELYPLPQTH
ncbi:helix-turn-helix domain-containing protein [Pediococcus siamensis]|uniref:helix-turn-helix domain-containing protein n=1 Tax=Pediococcus siamensis TaxID=381829 RepID=UPI0039A08694